jgi:deoxyuridine 5'-triphosphate nucleotidohydrolase
MPAAYLRRDARDARKLVTCESQASDGCRKTYQVSLRAEAKNRKHNSDAFICLPCSQVVNNSARRNPNARNRALDDDFFREIDSEAKAYLLGWVASDGSITRGTIAIHIHRKDAAVVEVWKQILGGALQTTRLRDLVGLVLSSQQMVRDVCRWLDIAPGKKSSVVAFPQLANDDLTWAFVRGFFDGDGCVVAPTQSYGPRCNITTGSLRFLEALRRWCPYKASYSRDRVEWSGNSALDFLGRLYLGASFRLPRKYDLYLDWCGWVPSLSGGGSSGRGLEFRWVRTDRAAVPPQKVRVSDSGYDLTIIKLVKSQGLMQLFDTGIKVQPDFGWYFDVVPRSSLSKTGYVLANSVGVIDRTYTGSILIALLKVDPEAPELALPIKVAQLIPRPIVHMQVVEVEELDDTERGGGGFGSTGR